MAYAKGIRASLCAYNATSLLKALENFSSYGMCKIL